MPVIPVYTPSQRLEPGSPVAAVSSEGSAGNMMGNMVERFGQTLVNLGDALDKKNKENKEKISRLTAAQIESRFEADLAGLENEYNKKYAVDNDPTGEIAVKAFREAATKLQQDYFDAIGDEETKLYFAAATGKSITSSVTRRYADETKKRDDDAKIRLQDLLAAKSLRAFKSPEEAGVMDLESEVLIREQMQLPEDEINKAIVENRDRIFKQATFGYVSQAKAQPTLTDGIKKFQDARKFLEANATILKDPEKFQSMLQMVDSERAKFVNEFEAIESAKEKMADRFEKDARKAALNFYYRKASELGPDVNRYEDLIKKARLDKNLSPEDVEKISGWSKQFTSVADDKYEFNFYKELYTKKKTTEQLVAQLDNDVYGDRPKLTPDTGSKLLRAIDEFKKKDQQNPRLSPMISDAKQLIESTYAEIRTNPVTGEREQIVTSVGLNKSLAFEQQIFKRIRQGESLDESSIMDLTKSFLRDKQMPVDVEFSNPAQYKTLEDVQAAKKEIIRKKQKGLIQKQDEDRVKKQYENLNILEKQMTEDKKFKLKGNAPATNQPIFTGE